MAFAQAQAQTQPPYGSILLNELHTYFPAILYQRQRFTSVQDLLGYVEQQMRSRYDLFSGWQNHFQTTNPLPQQQPQPQQQPSPRRYYNDRPRNSRWVPQTQQAAAAAQGPEIRFTMEPTTPTATTATTDTTSDLLVSSILNQYLPNDYFSQFIVRSMLGGGNTTTINTQQPQTFWDNVPVIPTAAQIAAASTTYVAPTPLETPCAICQTTIAEGENVRKLSHCNHFFHRSCVDTWFQRSVQCPSCRHDIRGNNRSNASAPS